MNPKYVLLYFLAGTAIVLSQPERPAREGTDKDVQVDRLSEPIPSEQGDADKFIWNKFSKRPEIQLFINYTTQDWRKNYDRFSGALVEKAKERQFESTELKLCLAKLLKEPVSQSGPEEIGYLPIGAYRATRGQRQVWVIFCLWEYATDPSKMKTDFAPPMGTASQTPTGRPVAPVATDWLTVGHIRIFTYELSSMELIGFVTCG